MMGIFAASWYWSRLSSSRALVCKSFWSSGKRRSTTHHWIAFVVREQEEQRWVNGYGSELTLVNSLASIVRGACSTLTGQSLQLRRHCLFLRGCRLGLLLGIAGSRVRLGFRRHRIPLGWLLGTVLKLVLCLLKPRDVISGAKMKVSRRRIGKLTTCPACDQLDFLPLTSAALPISTFTRLEPYWRY